MRNSIGTLQPIWDCRWSQVIPPASGVGGPTLPEAFWVCERPPEPRRPVTEQHCQQCEFWEAEDPHGLASTR